MSAKADRPDPENLRNAREWDKNKALYLRVGLCHKCAAQAAWGHALGFSRVHPPCLACLPVVEALEADKGNGWRSLGRPRNAYKGTPAAGGTRTPLDAEGAISGRTRQPHGASR